MKKKLSSFACAPAASALACAALLAPGAARAQFVERVYLHAEGGVGTMLSTPQSNQFGLGFNGSARLGLRIVGPVAIHAMAGYWNWSAGSASTTQNSGALTVFGGGLRIAPELSRSLGRIFLDGEAGYGITGAAGLEQVYIGGGIGWAIPIAGPLEFGPVGRVGTVLASGAEQSSQGGSGSALFWHAGLFIGLHGLRDEAPAGGPLDADGDGVLDSDDQCPTVPQGAHPDSTRRGCPAPSEDTDGDGVPDAVDQCPSVPQGELADPTRRGCPAGDRDGDNVVDPEDLCPDTPAGAHPDPNRRGCPASDSDSDHDGVPDSADQCPTEPAGMHPDPQRPGCPSPDRDHDTVPDAVDHCPDTAGAPSTDPNLNGCPSIVRMDAGRISILEPVLFDNGRATIKPQSLRVLDRVADVLRSTPQIRRVAVEGHTDDHGHAERNMTLSQQRTESVVAYLVSHAVEASRLEAHGYGQTRPLVPNTSAANRAQNRRVEFLIVDPPSLGAGAVSGASTVQTPGGPGVQILNVGVPEDDGGGRHGHHGHGHGGHGHGGGGHHGGGGGHHGHHH